MSEEVTNPIIQGDELKALNLAGIARLIRKTWKNKKGESTIYFGAKPYLEALASLDNVEESYGQDSAKSMVIYFLSNATAYRGDQAKAIKAELKRRIGVK